MGSEQNDSEFAIFEKGVGRMMATKDAIVRHINETHTNSGTIGCPNCGANLKFSRSPGNGHLMAKCASAGCVHFIE